LSQVLNTSVVQLAAELGVPLGELVNILGVEFESLTTTTAAGLSEVATLLGANIFELMEELGVPLRELAIVTGVSIDSMSAALVAELGVFAATLGVDVLELVKQLDISIAELAKTFDIGVESFSAEQFAALVAFSETLGASVSDMAIELGISLGKITEATSLLSQALDIAIAELPEAIQADLGPLLEAIRTATNEADANLAIGNLGGYILDLPADLQVLLKPFLDLIGFDEMSPELGKLTGIEFNTGATVDAIHALAAIPPAQPLVVMIPAPPTPIVIVIPPIIIPPYPGYADGGAVDRTGPAMLHAGEFVVTKTADNLSVSTGDNEESGDMAQVLNVLVDIREQNRRYQEADLATSRDMESSLKTQTEQQRRIANV